MIVLVGTILQFGSACYGVRLDIWWRIMVVALEEHVARQDCDHGSAGFDRLTCGRKMHVLHVSEVSEGATYLRLLNGHAPRREATRSARRTSRWSAKLH